MNLIFDLCTLCIVFFFLKKKLTAKETKHTPMPTTLEMSASLFQFLYSFWLQNLLLAFQQYMGIYIHHNLPFFEVKYSFVVSVFSELD